MAIVTQVNNADYPIDSVWIKNLSIKGPHYVGRTDKTNNKGIALLYVKPSSKQEILFDFREVYANLKPTLLLDVGSREKMPSGFTIVLLKSGMLQRLNTMDPNESELAAIQQAQEQSSDEKPVTSSQLDEIIFTTGLPVNNRLVDNVTEISINKKYLYILTKWHLTLEYHDIVIKTFDSSGKLVREDRNTRAPYKTIWGGLVHASD